MCLAATGRAPLIVAMKIAVLTVSDTRTLDTDGSGALIVDTLSRAGHAIVERQIVTDDVERIRQALSSFVQAETVECVVATGGTGITARDVTPEALAPLRTKDIPGFGECFRWLSYQEIGASTIQSRACAALCERTLVFLLPGSSGAVRLALEKIIVPQLDEQTRPCNFAQLLPRL